MARFEERQAIPAEQLRGLLAFYDGDIEGLAETHVLRIDHEDIDPLRSSSEPVEHLVQQAARRRSLLLLLLLLWWLLTMMLMVSTLARVVVVARECGRLG